LRAGCKLQSFASHAVETTIEEKHARVQLALKTHHIGPVGASLANRLPMLERLLSRGQIKVADLLAKFDQARHLRNAPALLGIDAHPTLQGVAKSKPSKLLAPLVNVVYRCDLASMFEDTRSAGRQHLTSKRKAAVVAARILKETMDPIGRDGIEGQLLKDHMVKVGTPQTMRTPPRSMLRPTSLDSKRARRETKRARLSQRMMTSFPWMRQSLMVTTARQFLMW
jgi:hypothetical protein